MATQPTPNEDGSYSYWIIPECVLHEECSEKAYKRTKQCCSYISAEEMVGTCSCFLVDVSTLSGFCMLEDMPTHKCFDTLGILHA